MHIREENVMLVWVVGCSESSRIYEEEIWKKPLLIVRGNLDNGQHAYCGRMSLKLKQRRIDGRSSSDGAVANAGASCSGLDIAPTAV